EELTGLELGAKSVNPQIKVTSTFTGDWNNVSQAKEATLALISSGADVIFQWLDNASPAVLQTAAEKNIYAFGNTKDQLEIAPQIVRREQILNYNSYEQNLLKLLFVLLGEPVLKKRFLHLILF
ncbi:MAG: BMP family ABC transporter substrate-binding protein, partial [Cyanobacteria bacterium J06636_27]